METAYRVLWYGPNPHVERGLSEYLGTLSEKFSELVSRIDPGGLLSSVARSERIGEFLISSDVAACLWDCSRGISKESLSRLCLRSREFLEGMPSHSEGRIAGTSVRLTVSDANPYAAYDAHPDNRKDGVGVGWGSADVGTWFRTYGEAFRILKNADSWFFEEIDRHLQKIVPLGTDDRAHRSASYAEAFGCVYMGLVPSEPNPEYSVLEWLIHEWSHNKANLARNLAPLVLNGREESYYSAYRPDPRPIEGIFLGAHAFVPTVRVFLRAFESGAIDPAKRVGKVFSMHLKNRSALEVVGKYGAFSSEGEAYCSEISSVHTENERLIEPFRVKFHQKFLMAEREFREHFDERILSYPFISY